MLKVLLIAKVVCSRLGPRGIVGEVVEGLMVELEQFVGAVGIGCAADSVQIRASRAGAIRVVRAGGITGRIVPTSRIPGPVHSARAQLVADIVRRQGREPAPLRRSGSVRLVPGLRCVHGIISANYAGRSRRTTRGRAA